MKGEVDLQNEFLKQNPGNSIRHISNIDSRPKFRGSNPGINIKMHIYKIHLEKQSNVTNKISDPNSTAATITKTTTTKQQR